MAGHLISLTLRQHPDLFDVADLARSKNALGPDHLLDLSNTAALQQLIEAEKPDLIINAAGILNQSAEETPDEAILINSYLPHFLERITSGTNCRIIHISTDCVFSGEKGGYAEQDIKDGKGYYAQTKALGELNNKKDLTIRTSIIGPELNVNGIGLFNWFARAKGAIQGYTNAYWSGVTTTELANAIMYLIKENTTGLYHLVNNEKISKDFLLRLFLKYFPEGGVTEINASGQYKVDKSLVNTRTDIRYKVPGYEDMIRDMKEWMTVNSGLYPQYASLLK